MNLKEAEDKIINLILSSDNSYTLSIRMNKIFKEYKVDNAEGDNNNNNNNSINQKINQVFYYMEYLYPKFNKNPLAKYQQSNHGLGLKFDKNAEVFDEIDISSEDREQYIKLIKLLLKDIISNMDTIDNTQIITISLDDGVGKKVVKKKSKKKAKKVVKKKITKKKVSKKKTKKKVKKTSKKKVIKKKKIK